METILVVSAEKHLEKRTFSFVEVSRFSPPPAEISLLMDEHYQGTVKATTVCFVFCLSRDNLTMVLHQFPTLRASLEARARERLQELLLSERRPLHTIPGLFSDSQLESSYESENEHHLEHVSGTHHMNIEPVALLSSLTVHDRIEIERTRSRESSASSRPRSYSANYHLGKPAS